MSDIVGQTLKSFGLDICDLSIDWLTDMTNTKSPLLWLCKNLTFENVLTKDEALAFSQLNEDEILNDEQLDIEFENIDKSSNSNLLHVKFDSIQEKAKADHSNEKIKLATNLLENLEKCISQGLAVSSKFDKQLDHCKNKRNEKFYELLDVTQNCEDMKMELKNKKNNLKNVMDIETMDFISLGKDLNEQVNEDIFEEYFCSCNNLSLFFQNYINTSDTLFCNNVDDTLNCRVIDSFISQRMNFEPIDPKRVSKTSKKLETAIENYIISQAELAEAEELLKFYHKYDGINFDTLLSSSRDANKSMAILFSNKKEVQRTVKSFVKENTVNILCGDVQLKTLNIQYILDELTMIQSSVRSMLLCSDLLLSSLKNHEKKKDIVVSYFYSAVKTLIHDITLIHDRKNIIDNIKELTVNLQCVEKFLNIKKDLYKWLQFEDNASLENALQHVESNINKLNDVKVTVFEQQFRKSVLKFDHMKNDLSTLRNFIWDGAINQPNICNRVRELKLFEFERDVENSSEEYKKAANVLKDFLISSDSKSTI